MAMTGRPSAQSITAVVFVSAWLGAAALVSLVVAPAAFAVLPSRTLAGALVGRVLPVLFWSGAAAAALGVLLTRSLPSRAARLIASAAIVLPCVAAQLVVAPRIQRLREAIGGPIDLLAAGDPRRLEFGRLHGVSVALLGVALVAAVAWNVLIARQMLARSVP